jgi:hypothetical protein
MHKQVPSPAKTERRKRDMSGRPYSQKENDLLLKEMAHSLEKEDFDTFVSLWPGLFKGETRSAYALYRQMRRLSKRHGVILQVKNVPFFHNYKKERQILVQSIPDKVISPFNQKPSSKRNRFRLQVENIIHKEVFKCTKRISHLVEELVKKVLEENQDLSKELRELRPYKNIVEIQYRKETGR